jgi:Anti-sigma factor NepR
MRAFLKSSILAEHFGKSRVENLKFASRGTLSVQRRVSPGGPAEEGNVQNDGNRERDKLKMNTSSLSSKEPGAAGREKQGKYPSLAPEIQAQIGRRLTAAYDDVLQQPVPDRFRLLLDELDKKSTPSKVPGSDNGGVN